MAPRKFGNEAGGICPIILLLRCLKNSCYRQRKQRAERYVSAYRQYCWPVQSVADLKLAPFHILATQGETHIHKNHQWHMDALANICQADVQLLLAIPYTVVDVTDTASAEAGIAWWTALTGRGGEGMVVKP